MWRRKLIKVGVGSNKSGYILRERVFILRSGCHSHRAWPHKSYIISRARSVTIFRFALLLALSNNFLLQIRDGSPVVNPYVSPAEALIIFCFTGSRTA